MLGFGGFVVIDSHHIQQIGHEACKVANPASGQLNREINFPVPVHA